MLAFARVKPRDILDQTLTPDGDPLELVREGGHFVLRVASIPLMSSAAYGSEQAMAKVAAEVLGERKAPRVLVGGLGMGYTLRAALDTFGRRARVTVAELLPPLVRYNHGVLGHLARHPLRDPRVTLFEGDVRAPLAEGGWDVVLMDVDNGPDALTADDNETLYGDAGAALMARALSPGGVLVVWSAYSSRAFERTLRRAGCQTQTRRVSARPGGKGSKHVLFVGKAPRSTQGRGKS